MTTPQIISLISIFFGGVVSAFVVSWLTSRRDLKDYKRKKVEELYEVIRQDSIDYFNWYIRYLTLFEGSIELDKFNNYKANVSPTLGSDRKTKAEMLASLYVPSVKADLELYWEAKIAYTSTINDVYIALQETGKLPDFSKLNSLRSNVNSSKDNLLEKFAKVSNKL